MMMLPSRKVYTNICSVEKRKKKYCPSAHLLITKNGLYDILVERTIRYALGATVFPGRFLPKESRQMQNYVVTFAICGLMTIMIQWHSTGYSCSVQEMAKVASRLLTKPLFPEAEKFL